MKQITLKDQLLKIGLDKYYDLYEIVESVEKFTELPQATKDSLQIISDVNNLCFKIVQKKNKLCIVGAVTKFHSLYLYPDDDIAYDKQRKFLKGSREGYVIPNGENKIYDTLAF